MSNKYWGWGREDDDLYVRLEKANFVVSLNPICDYLVYILDALPFKIRFAQVFM